jgi:hypothetical protein
MSAVKTDLVRRQMRQVMGRANPEARARELEHVA